MKDCIHCKPTKDKLKFARIGKTYYILSSDRSILCHRHWYQANKPNYIVSAEFDMLQQRLKEVLNSK